MENPGGTDHRDGPGALAPQRHSDRADLYRAIQRDGQRLSMGLIHYLHAAADHAELNPTDYQCLLLLRFGGPLSPSEISQRLRLASGSTTVVIDRLETRGLVFRTSHPDDRRKRIVKCVDDLRGATGAGGTGMREAMTALHDRYSDAELATISGWLHQLSEVLLSMNGGPPEPRD
ncbi:MarR family transcriptional regulator [Spiractinospora alimapuensis]|uniref:MarR family winged helix-turn-helix transcriptional regulator n=1 Tax=Spiractinospora alimapuensis TaxID=2820884 RepID=UPI001F30BD7F|nr:MarR family transcriptional regulator [Spiractinospora alimapuensis]QVQ54261.1 MarR family transcriptional regulator [Spiractinospora alimapuensis]